MSNSAEAKSGLLAKHLKMFRRFIRESSREKKRTVTMRCLCLGFDRPGAASMCAAMEMIGIRGWHSTLLQPINLGDCEMWKEAMENKFSKKGPILGRPEVHQRQHNFGGASSDTAAITFAEYLTIAYPKAKVVLVVLDTGAWFKSYENAVIERTAGPPTRKERK